MKKKMRDLIKKVGVAVCTAAAVTCLIAALPGRPVCAANTSSMDFTVTDVTPYTVYTTTRLNIRKGPGIRWEFIRTLDKEEEVTVTGVADTQWLRVKASDVPAGYISYRFVTDVKGTKSLWLRGLMTENGTPAAEAKTAETKTADTKTADTKATETKTADTKTDDTKATETKAAETKATDTKAAETKTDDTKASETKAADTKTTDTKATDTKATDTKAAVTKAADIKETETTKEEVKKEETRKEEIKQEETKKEETKAEETAKAEEKKEETKKEETAKAEETKAPETKEEVKEEVKEETKEEVKEEVKEEPAKEETKEAEPAAAEIVKEEPVKAEPAKEEPVSEEAKEADVTGAPEGIPADQIGQNEIRVAAADGSHEHVYTGTVMQESACSHVGIISYTCAECGETFTEVIPRKEHTPGGWETVRSATLTEDGLRYQNCSVCGRTLASASIPAKKWGIILLAVLGVLCLAGGYVWLVRTGSRK